MDTTSVRPPPEGQDSNLKNPVSRAYQLEILIGVMTALVIIFTSLRIYCRRMISHGFGADDWLCMVATVFVLAYSGLILHLLDKPGGGVIGIHLWDVSRAKYVQYFKGSLADSVLIRITNTLIKVAFFVFYLRLFHVYGYVRIMIWVGMVVVVTFCVVFVVTDLVACSPWPGEEGGWIDPAMISRCGSIARDLITTAAYFSVITDFYLLFIPLHLVPKLGLPLRKKLGLSLIFLTGVFATGAGLANVIIRADNSIFEISDFTWTIVPVYATCLVEINVGVICHSMPVVFGYFVGHITSLGKSLSSWIQERRARRNGPSDSSANLTLDSNTAPQLSQSTPNATLTGARKFIKNLYRSGGRTSVGDSTTWTNTYHEPPTPLHDYHEHLRTQTSRPKMNNRGEQA